MEEIAEILSDAGHPLTNENGHLAKIALSELVAQRDELLAALKIATEGLRIWSPADAHITQFDALIAKVEGTTP